MPKIKRRHEDALLRKAVKAFDTGRQIITGELLTRRELRKLERMGIVERQLMRNKDTGAYIYGWGMVRRPQMTGIEQ